jgi:hypothetical protein
VVALSVVISRAPPVPTKTAPPPAVRRPITRTVGRHEAPRWRELIAVAADTAAASSPGDDSPRAPPAGAAAPEPSPASRSEPASAPPAGESALPALEVRVAEPLAPADLGAGVTSTGAPGNGTGTAAGPGSGRDSRPAGTGLGWSARRRRRALELFGRVVGGTRECAVPAHADLPCASLRESTALRVRDHFPRLPAALWPDPRPYVVSVEICVSSEGAVTDAVLLSNQSDRLDAVVLDAVLTWRYRPRLTAGQPAPFCHDVVIQYDSP